MADSKGSKAEAAGVQLEFGARIGQVTREPEPRVLTVSHIVRLAARALERHFLDVWVEGEVSNLRQPGSGHAYFTLKDANAQLAAVLFRSTLQRLRLDLADGQLLRCRGRLSIYERQGRFQLTVEHAEPAGVGALQVAFERLKAKLASEGLFDEANKKPLPAFARRIAVVTSRTGAALRDIVRVLDARYPVVVTVCPAAVQGAEAPAEICAALKRADRCGADLIIVGRGGGSVEDLQAFNDERVARAVYRLDTPAISAVGHEIDFVITDFVADARAPTPSAAAEMAVPVMAAIRQQLQVLDGRLGRAVRQRLRHDELRLTRLRARQGSPRQLVDRSRMQLDDLLGRLQQLVERQLRARRERLSGAQLRLSHNRPDRRLERDRNTLQRLTGRLEGALQARLGEQRAQLARAATALQALSPLAVLGRGYSLAQDLEGHVVRDATKVQVGQRLLLRLHRGQLGCRVEQVEQVEQSSREKRR